MAAELDGRRYCDWCDGERITCEEGLCDGDGPHDCPRGLGEPLAIDEIQPDEWMQFHTACRVKFSQLIGDLSRKGVVLTIGGVEVAP